MYDTIVIGGGAVGMFTALKFAKHSERVLLLEAGQLGGQASWAGGGILSPLTPWHEDADMLQLADYSQSLYPDIAKELVTTTGIDPEYLPSGYLILNPGDESEWRHWAAATKPRLINDVREFHTAFNPVENDALFLPWVAQIRNPCLIKAMQSMLSQHGVSFLEHSPVTAFDTDGSLLKTVSTKEHQYKAERFVLCAGAWLNELTLGVKECAIKPVRGQMLLIHAPDIELQNIVIQEDCYLIPRKDGHILIGSTVEEVGFDATTTQAAAEYLYAKAIKILPPLADYRPVKQWAGLRPRSQRGKPVIGPSLQFENVYYNVGHFRIGLTLAPASAELLWQQVFGKNTFMSPAAFQIESLFYDRN